MMPSDNPQMYIPEIGDKLPTHNSRFSRILGKVVLKMTGWRFDGQLPNHSKMVIVAAPHTSNWDAFYGFAGLLALGIKISWMAKHSLFKWPVKKLMMACGGIPINRTASHGLVEQSVSEFGKREHLLLAITPEGTRTRVEKWKTGFYFIAEQAKVPILVGFLDYSKKQLGFGPILQPTGNVTDDLLVLQNFYEKIGGKHPEKFNTSFL